MVGWFGCLDYKLKKSLFTYIGGERKVGGKFLKNKKKL